jgi:hypothetical protein
MKHLIWAILAATTLQACAALNMQPRVTRRYASATFLPAAVPAPAVDLSVFATTVPRSGTETVITNLSDRGQAELIRAMVSRTQTAQTLAEAMAYPVRRPTPLPGLRDLTELSRRLVFSIDNGSVQPADRVSTARIRVILRDSARFTGWDRITTRFDTVDLGKISTDQSRSVGAELGLELPVLSAAPSLNVSSENALHEEVALRQRRVALTGALGDGVAVLTQQGAAGIDLMGNVTADFQLSAKRHSDQQLIVGEYPQASGLPECAAGPRLQSQMVRVPQPNAISADVYLDYVLRRVVRGQATVTESDDAVVFEPGRDSVMNVIVVPGDMLQPAAFTLKVGAGSDRDPTLHVTGVPSGINAGAVTLRFPTYENAMGMLAWLRGCKASAVGYTLTVGFGGPVLTESDLGRMYVWRDPLAPPVATSVGQHP